MGEWTSALRATDAQILDALYVAMLDSGCGRTVFVAGDDRDGRSALLKDWLDGLGSMRVAPRVLGGVFEDDCYVPWERDRVGASDALRALDRLLSGAGSVASLLDLALPSAVSSLLGQVLSKCRAALELTHRVLAAPGEHASGMLVPRALRRVCEDGPVVCVIEAADLDAGGLWADLVLRFARRVATEVPLLLVLSLDGPQHLGAHSADEPAGLNVARQLTSDEVDVATWRWLSPLSEHDLSRWTGPCAPGVLDALLQITGGRSGWTVALWREWRLRGVVQDTIDGRWRLAAGRDRVFEDVDDIVDERVRRLVGGELSSRARMQRLLACAALEGRRFTAAAVAEACGWDADETIDILDDTLSNEEDDLGDGFVRDEGFVTVRDERGTRHLATYRFARELDWMTLRHHGLSPSERRHLAARLARAVQAAYGAQAARVASTLRMLFALAGDAATAAHYRRMADNGLDHDVLLWRAQNVLGDGDPVEPSERRRVCALLLASAEALINIGPFDDGLAFASAAQRLSDQRANSVHAGYLVGVHQLHLGAYEVARQAFADAARAFGELGDRGRQVRARHGLALIDEVHGEDAAAREQFTTILALYRELGDRVGEADARHELARIYGSENEYAAAREQFTTILALRRELGDRHGEARARHELAKMDRLQDEYAAAREQFTAVLALRRELRDRLGEAADRYEIALIDRLQGEYAAAREQFTTALALFRELGDRRGEAATRHQLALVARLRGECAPAREHFATALALYGELGDRPSAAECQAAIAELDTTGEDSHPSASDAS